MTRGTKSMLLLLGLFMVAQSAYGANFNYLQDFTGTVGTQPTDWTVYQGAPAINEDFFVPGEFVYETNHASEANNGAYYAGGDSANWVNYTFECDFTQTWTFPTGMFSSSTLWTGVTFRLSDSDHAYLVRIRKNAGYANPQVMLGYFLPLGGGGRGIEWIEEAESSAPLLFNGGEIWYHLKIEVNGLNIKVTLSDREFGDILAVIDVTDTTYVQGTVGIHSNMNATNLSVYDNITVVGDTDLTCDILVAQGANSPADLNEDCVVDFADFTQFAGSWLDCLDPLDPDCQVKPWIP